MGMQNPIRRLPDKGRRAVRWAGLILPACLLACTPGPDPSKITRDRIYSLLEHFPDAVVEESPIDRTELKIIETGEEERPGIITHAPSIIRYGAVPLHAGAALRLEYGLAGISDCKGFDGVVFSLEIDAGGRGAERVWESRLASGAIPWHQKLVDLEKYEGETVDLILRTEPLRTKVCGPAAWGHSRLLSKGRSMSLSDIPIQRRVHDHNLLDRMRPRTAEATQPSFEHTIELPESPALEVAGSLLRGQAGTGTLGPARFVVEQDGRIVLDRVLQSEKYGDSFFAWTPLADAAGKPSDLSFRIENDDGNSRALWTWVSVSRTETVERLPSGDGPNLLLLVVDTLRADHLGLYGYARPTSPNLDRFARESLVFDTAIAQSSWTHPATASLLTGLYPITHDVLGGQRLDPKHATLPRILQRAGVTTFGLSANPILGRNTGFHRGFETFVHLRWARADVVNDVFRRWVEQQQGLRWFAYLHYIDPHGPYDAPYPYDEEFTDGYKGRLTDNNVWRKVSAQVNFRGTDPNLTPADRQYLEDAYDGEILFWDRQFGELIPRLRAAGVLDDTIIVVVSDHGEEFLEHGKLQHGPHLYDESIHVPLIIRAPGRVEPGRHAAQVETRGLMRALLDMMEIPSEGESWPDLPSVFDEAPGPVLSHTVEKLEPGDTTRRDLLAAREPGWKLILRPEAGSVELYDLVADPREQAEAALQHAEHAAALRSLLETYLRLRDASEEGEPVDPETIQRLRALGYVN